MTPEQALQILDQASAMAHLISVDNDKRKEAVKVLRDLLESLKKEGGK